MDLSKAFAISAFILVSIGSALSISLRTRAVGVGVIAGGATYAFFALLTLLMGI